MNHLIHIRCTILIVLISDIESHCWSARSTVLITFDKHSKSSWATIWIYTCDWLDQLSWSPSIHIHDRPGMWYRFRFVIDLITYLDHIRSTLAIIPSNDFDLHSSSTWSSITKPLFIIPDWSHQFYRFTFVLNWTAYPIHIRYTLMVRLNRNINQQLRSAWSTVSITFDFHLWSAWSVISIHIHDRPDQLSWSSLIHIRDRLDQLSR